MTNYVSQIAIGRDLNAASYRVILAELREAFNDPACLGVILDVDSNGGEFSGAVTEIADAIFYAAKPVYAFVAGEALSAGYWIASQARGGISASRAANIGSIGVVGMVIDSSEAAARAGQKVHVVRTVPNKSRGLEGEVVTQEFIDQVAKEAAQADAIFRSDVKRARPNVDLSKQLGDCFLAPDAIALNLIDRVENYTAFLDRLIPARTPS